LYEDLTEYMEEGNLRYQNLQLPNDRLLNTRWTKISWEEREKTPPSQNTPEGRIVRYRIRKGNCYPRGSLPGAIADIVQEVAGGLRKESIGVMGAHWLFGGMQRLGKATSSVVIFFKRKPVLERPETEGKVASNRGI